jgi:hypothetical protein
MPTVTGGSVTGDSAGWAVLACGAIVAAAEWPTIALLRRRGLGVPAEAVAGGRKRSEMVEA